MRLRSLRAQHFRNHENTYLEFGSELNAFLGENGQGKTNLLEAISYACLTKSFFGAADGVIVRHGEEIFSLELELVADNGLTYRLSAASSPSAEVRNKQFTINAGSVERLSDMIGMFPLVVLAPEHKDITNGNPGERRKFLDLLISQSSRSYFEDLLEFKRVLRQRNRVLMDARMLKRDCRDLLEPWDDAFALRAVRLMSKRRSFVEEFIPYIHESYRNIAGDREVPQVFYEPNIRTNENSDAVTRDMILETLRRSYPDDVRSGSSQRGPHRDDLSFNLADLEIRKYASQGQHKTFLLALKIGEFFYLKERASETPTLLLDDVFSELDRSRASAMLDLMPTLGQTFITATDEQLFPPSFPWSAEKRRYLVRNGTVTDAV